MWAHLALLGVCRVAPTGLLAGAWQEVGMDGPKLRCRELIQVIAQLSSNSREGSARLDWDQANISQLQC